MKRSLSIVIPVFNTSCKDLVLALEEQIEKLKGVKVEIVVGDDGSTDTVMEQANRLFLKQQPHVRYIAKPRNQGRGAIRNTLADAAMNEWILFLDCHLHPTRPDFLQRYLDQTTAPCVVVGGTHIEKNAKQRNNLRYVYERNYSRHHNLDERRKMPYAHFVSNNFMAHRGIMQRCRFRTLPGYGHEDTLFGKELRNQGIRMVHIDNPVTRHIVDTNDAFLAEVEESLQTLYLLRGELCNYSLLLDTALRMRKWHLALLFLLFFNLVKVRLRHQLLLGKPRLYLFAFYKLGYYLALEQQNSAAKHKNHA